MTDVRDPLLQAQHLFVHQPGGRLGLHAKLPLQHRRAGLVHPQRACTVLVQGMQAHQPAVRPFMQRVDTQALLAVLDGGPVVALLLQQADEAIEHAPLARRQPLPQRRDPVVVGTRQQLAAVDGRGLLERDLRSVWSARSSALVAVSQRLHVGVDIELDPGSQRQRARVHQHEAVRVRPRDAELMKELAEAVARLRLGRVGPQQERDVAARLRGIAMEGQVGQQRLRTRCVEGHSLAGGSDEPEGAQQAKLRALRQDHRAPTRHPRLPSGSA